MLKKLLGALALLFITIAAPQAHKRALYFYVGHATVKLTPTWSESAGGTGFQIQTPDGPRLLTNAHVCKLGEEDGLLWSTHEWKKTRVYVHRILRVDERADLCLLDGRPDLTTLRLSPAPASGLDRVYTVGHPALEPLTLSEGYVRSRQTIQIPTRMPPGLPDEACDGEIFEFWGKYCVRPFDSVSTSIRGFGGSSGSPVVNSFGLVTGVVFAGNSGTNHLHYVPFSLIESFLQSS